MGVPVSSTSCPFSESHAEKGGLMVKTNLLKSLNTYRQCLVFVMVTGRMALCNPL